MCNRKKLYYCVLGDLAFFYDLNSLGNRHIANNVRILLVNNGKGTEFKLSGNPGHLFGDETDLYIAAGGHYGCKSRELVKHYAEDLGFEYYSVDSKESFMSALCYFITPDVTDKPMILEAFTDSEDENEALTIIRSCMASEKDLRNGKMKKTLKNVLGEKNISRIKKIVKK